MTANTDRFCHDTIVYEDFIGPQQLEIFNRILAQNGCATVSAMQTSLKKQSKPDDEARIAMFSQWLGIQSQS